MTDQTKLASFELYPGSMGLVGLCFDLLGGDHVIPGQWPGPVGLRDVSNDDVQAIIQIAKEQGVTLKSRPVGSKLAIKDPF